MRSGSSLAQFHSPPIRVGDNSPESPSPAAVRLGFRVAALADALAAVAELGGAVLRRAPEHAVGSSGAVMNGTGLPSKKAGRRL